jgi:ParB/RepB/Spo0J family partition protein
MTSGQFKSFPLDQIFVDRESRQRRSLEDIESQAQSMAEVGLINPIVIGRSGKLIAGERRFMAAQSLGWTNISVQFIEDLPQEVVWQIELEENIRRKNLTWQDECEAIKKYHELKVKANPEWTQVDTAKALNSSQQDVSYKVSIATEISKGNTRVALAPKLSTAKNIVDRIAARKRDSTIAELTDQPKAKEPPLLNADFLEWSKSYAGPKFNFIHCDFPYGVNADEHDQGSASDHGGYEDSFETYEALISGLHNSMENVVAESAHLMFWFSLDYYEYTRNRLVEMGWRINPFPLVWFKSDNTGIIPDAKRGPRRVYETAFFGSRGDRFIVAPVSNLMAHPSIKHIHMSEKPFGMLKHFFRMFVDEYSTVLDPTAGSANSIRVADSMGAAACLGIERDLDFFEQARERFYEDEL